MRKNNSNIQILKENRLKIPNTNSRKNLLEKYCFHQNLKSSRIDQNDDVPLLKSNTKWLREIRLLIEKHYSFHDDPNHDKDKQL